MLKSEIEGYAGFWRSPLRERSKSRLRPKVRNLTLRGWGVRVLRSGRGSPDDNVLPGDASPSDLARCQISPEEKIPDLDHGERVQGAVLDQFLADLLAPIRRCRARVYRQTCRRRLCGKVCVARYGMGLHSYLPGIQIFIITEHMPIFTVSTSPRRQTAKSAAPESVRYSQPTTTELSVPETSR